MNRLRRLLGLDEPQETRFFLLIAGWAAALGLVYLFVGDDPAGNALLVGLFLASGSMAAYLILARRSAVVRRQDRDRPLIPAHEADTPVAGAGGVDRPFQDETGRIPDPTLAPFAVGLGLALGVTAPIFGVAPLLVGVLPLAWGCWAWFSGAWAEHDELSGDTEGRGAHESPRGGAPR